jgi:hypothetical protein
MCCLFHGLDTLINAYHDVQVYLVSAVGEDALAVWHRRFLTAQIIGPGSRTSGLPCPSQPVLLSRTHNRYSASQSYIKAIYCVHIHETVDVCKHIAVACLLLCKCCAGAATSKC